MSDWQRQRNIGSNLGKGYPSVPKSDEKVLRQPSTPVRVTEISPRRGLSAPDRRRSSVVFSAGDRLPTLSNLVPVDIVIGLNRTIPMPLPDKSSFSHDHGPQPQGASRGDQDA